MLTIRRTRVFHGPCAYAPLPAVVMEVDIGELEERLGREDPGLLRAPHRADPLAH